MKQMGQQTETELLPQLSYLFNHCTVLWFLFPKTGSTVAPRPRPKGSPEPMWPERSHGISHQLFLVCSLMRTVLHHLQNFCKELRLRYGHPNNFIAVLWGNGFVGSHLPHECCWLLEFSWLKYRLHSSAEGCHCLFMRNLPLLCSCAPREINVCHLIII